MAKKKVQQLFVNTVSHLAEANPDYLEEALLQSILSGNTIASALMFINTQGFTSLVELTLQNIIDDSTPVSSEFLSSNLHGSTAYYPDTTIASIISNDLNLAYGCIVEFNFIARMTPYIAVLPFLYNERGYQAATNRIVAISTWTFPVKYNGYYTVPIITLSDVTLDAAIPLLVHITYTAVLWYRLGSTNTLVPETEYTTSFTEEYTLDSSLLLNKEYYIAGYRALDAAAEPSAVRDWWFHCTEADWWYYSSTDQQYFKFGPTIEQQSIANSLPIIPIADYHGIYSSSYKADHYSYGKEIAEEFGIGYDELLAEVAASPDIDKLELAVIMFGANLKSDSPYVISYLIDFFTYLNASDDITIWDSLTTSIHAFNSFSNYTGEIVEDRDTNLFTDSLSNRAVHNPVKQYSVIDSYKGITTDLTYSYMTSYLSPGSIGSPETTVKTVDPDSNVLILQKQISENIYRTVFIIDLELTTTRTRYWRYESDPVDSLREQTFSSTLTPKMLIDDPDSGDFIIPLYKKIADEVTVGDRNQLYRDSLILYCSSYDMFLVNNSQSRLENFLDVLGFLSVGAWVFGFGGAVSAGVEAVAYYLVETYVIQEAIKLGVKALSPVIAKYLEPEIATLLSIGMMVAAQYAKSKSASFKAWDLEIPTAEVLMFGVSVAETAGQISLAMEFDKLTVEYTEWMVDAEAQWAILEAKKEELEPNHLIPIGYLLPTVYNKPDTISSPDDLYNKVHQGNVGVFTLDMIDTYVDRALTLPQVNLL